MSTTPYQLDLSAYFSRIACPHIYEPTLDNLRTLVLHHTQSIPFENLSPFLGQTVSLDPAEVENKLLHAGRGGYCFEQNLLLSYVLQAIGFSVRPLGARVLWNKPEGTISARSHMLLAVALADRYWIVDVGFGAQTLTGILALDSDLIQDTPHGPFRLLEEEQTWQMQAQFGGEWHRIYQFDWQRQYAADYEVSNYYMSTHPNSLFVGNLIAARPTPEGRISLHNRVFTIYPHDAAPVRQQLNSAEAVCAVLENAFGLTLPTPALLCERLNRLP